MNFLGGVHMANTSILMSEEKQHPHYTLNNSQLQSKQGALFTAHTKILVDSRHIH